MHDREAIADQRIYFGSYLEIDYKSSLTRYGRRPHPRIVFSGWILLGYTTCGFDVQQGGVVPVQSPEQQS